jgi:hypothetical protein
LLEIGQPRILKRAKDIKEFQTILFNNFTEKESGFKSKCYIKDFKDCNGDGILCQFCNKRTIAYASNKRNVIFNF